MRRAEHLEQRSIAQREGEGEGEGGARPGEIERPEEDEEGKRRGEVKQEQVERGDIERPEEDADGRGRGWKRLIEERWRKWK